MIGKSFAFKIPCPVATVLDEFDVIFSAHLTHRRHVLVRGVLGFTPQFLVPLAPMQARHDDVRRGAPSQFDDQFFQVCGISIGVGNHQVGLIRNREVPCPPGQVLPGARIAHHLLIADGRRVRESFRDFLPPGFAVAEHVRVTRPQGPDQEGSRRIEAPLELLQGQRQVLAVRGSGRRDIVGRAVRACPGAGEARPLQRSADWEPRGRPLEVAPSTRQGSGSRVGASGGS